MHTNTHSVGVIIARFQVPSLHKGHKHLIETVSARHEKVLVLLGVSGGMTTSVDPLDFPTRELMVKHLYPNVHVHPVYDAQDDAVWSEEIDELIARLFPAHEAVLYGSRGSFIPHYKGVHKTHELAQVSSVSGTDIREKVCEPSSSKEFRKGMIYAARKRFPTSYQTVDIAIVKFESNEILLGQRTRDRDKFRFFGGFVDPNDESLELASKREGAVEEAGNIEIGNPQYIGSFRINDYRYRKAQDKVMTSLFIAPYIFGAPRAGDDIDVVAWHPIATLLDIIVPEHAVLAEHFIDYYTKHHLNSLETL